MTRPRRVPRAVILLLILLALAVGVGIASGLDTHVDGPGADALQTH